MKRGIRAIIVGLLLVCYVSAFAIEQDTIKAGCRESHPVNSIYMVECGGAELLDTYLSPLKYDGVSMALRGEWSKAMRQNPRHLMMLIDASLYGSIADSPAGNSSIYDIGIGFRWQMMYKWQPVSGLQVAAGGGLQLDAGAMYLRRNSNNPVSARASIDLTANAMLSYRTKFFGVPVRLMDRVTLPSLGVCFSPEYGESYYEIYLGNHDGLVHCGWWGNHFSVENLLAADFSMGDLSLRLGYRLDCRSSYISNINTRRVSHAFVLGLSYDWQTVKRDREQESRIFAY